MSFCFFMKLSLIPCYIPDTVRNWGPQEALSLFFFFFHAFYSLVGIRNNCSKFYNREMFELQGSPGSLQRKRWHFSVIMGYAKCYSSVNWTLMILHLNVCEFIWKKLASYSALVNRSAFAGIWVGNSEKSICVL